MFALFQLSLSAYAPGEVVDAARFNNMIVINNDFEGSGLYYLRGDGKNFTAPSNLQRGALNMELCPFKYSATYDNYTRCLTEFAGLSEVEVVFGAEVHKINIVKNETALQNASFDHQGKHVHADVDFQNLEYPLHSEDYEETVFVTCTCSNATHATAFAITNFTVQNGHISADFDCDGFGNKLAPYVKNTTLMNDERIKVLMTLGNRMTEACRADAEAQFDTCKLTIQDRSTDRSVSTGEVQLKRNIETKTEL